MRIYNQDKTQEIFDPDLTKGKLVESTLFISHHPEQEKVEGKTAEEVAKALLEAGEKVFLDEKKNCWYRVKEEYKNGGRWVEKIDGIREIPKKEAWDEYEDIYVYIPYTENELAAVAANNAISEAKAYLSKTDYIVLKIAEATAEGDAAGVAALQEEYAEQLAARKQARATVNENESVLKRKLQ